MWTFWSFRHFPTWNLWSFGNSDPEIRDLQISELEFLNFWVWLSEFLTKLQNLWISDFLEGFIKELVGFATATATATTAPADASAATTTANTTAATTATATTSYDPPPPPPKKKTKNCDSQNSPETGFAKKGFGSGIRESIRANRAI